MMKSRPLGPSTRTPDTKMVANDDYEVLGDEDILEVLPLPPSGCYPRYRSSQIQRASSVPPRPSVAPKVPRVA